MGGVAASAYGATRETKDFDCVVRRAKENLNRLAAALRELNARLRVAGLSDEEAALLPMQIDAVALNAVEISTWANAVLLAHADAEADQKLQQAYRRQPQDPAIVESALRLARVTVPDW